MRPIFFTVARNRSAGALTTSAIPPKVEVLALEAQTGKQERYSFDRNIEQLDLNNSKTVFYQTIGHKFLTAWQYFFIIFYLNIFIYFINI